MSYNTYMLHKIVNIHYFNINNRTISLHINNRNKLETFISGAYKDPLFFFLHYERKIFIWRFKILAFYGILSMYLLAINAFVCVISSTHTNLLYPSVVHVIRFISIYLFFFESVFTAIELLSFVRISSTGLLTGSFECHMMIS